MMRWSLIASADWAGCPAIEPLLQKLDELQGAHEAVRNGVEARGRPEFSGPAVNA